MTKASSDVRYSLRPHPLLKRAWQILKHSATGDLLPIGEYIVMDKNENVAVSQRKAGALQTCLNGRDPFGQEEQIRNSDRGPETGQTHAEQLEKKNTLPFISFQRIGPCGDNDLSEKIIFYRNSIGSSGETRRKVNAILSLARGQVETVHPAAVPGADATTEK